jgi:flagellin
MAFSVVTNVASLSAQRNLARTQESLSKNMSRLSSGLRINSAADDAAGLGISEKLRAQTRGLAQAERNAMDGVSLLQTAEGTLNEVSGILVRMRELALSSSTDTNNDTQRAYLNEEFTALSDELTRLTEVTDFNGTKLLDGSLAGAPLEIQVGLNADPTNDRIQISIPGMDSATLGVNVDISTKAVAQGVLATLDTAIDTVSESRAGLGALQNRMQITISNLTSSRENLTAANSRIRDVDVAEETAAMTRNSILMQAGVSVLSQANQAPQVALSLLGR